MSSFAITNPQAIDLQQASLTGQVAAATTQPSDPAPASDSAPQDTVKLSSAAQAQAMYRAGESVNSIASSLGLSASMVDSYLGIAQTIAVPTQVATSHSGSSGGSAATTAAASTPAAHVSVNG